MATTPSQNVANRAVALVQTALTHTTTTYAKAASNYGTDFRIPDSTCHYQIQTTLDGIEIGQSNETYYRVRLTVILNYKAVDLADEKRFSRVIVDDVGNGYLLRQGSWGTGDATIYDLAEDDGDPEIDDTEKEGNVLTWKLSITVLAPNTL